MSGENWTPAEGKKPDEFSHETRLDLTLQGEDRGVSGAQVGAGEVHADSHAQSERDTQSQYRIDLWRECPFGQPIG